jgi:uncharacterized protein YjbI with pentapeptide repeats
MRGKTILTAMAAAALGLVAVRVVSAGTTSPVATASPTVQTAPATPSLPDRQVKWRVRLLYFIGWILTAVIARAAWRTPDPVWLRWVLIGLATGAAASLVMAALLGPGARRLAGEGAPLTGDEREALTIKDRVEAVNSARQTLIQSTTGLVVIGGVVFTALGLWYTAKTLDSSQQGQIADRYTRAIEQLGSDKRDVRLGGIYALERLANDSDRDHQTVYDVLAAFTLEHDPKPGAKVPDQPTTDLQTALTVISRRHAIYDSSKLSLQGLRAHGAILELAQLDLADMGGADLTHANLASAHLLGVTLVSANLTEARLTYADLTAADLSSARLFGAELTGANLSRASLRDAYMHGAKLTGAKVTDADLYGADLTGANLYRAQLTSADLARANLVGAYLYGTNLTAADLTDAHLAGAHLADANLTRANLTRAHLAGAYLAGADLTGANLAGADLTDVWGMTPAQIRAVAKTDATTRF